MADVFLIIVAVVIAVCILIGVLMMYTYFGNPDDKEEHLLPKIIVVREAKCRSDESRVRVPLCMCACVCEAITVCTHVHVAARL